jgi:hypothetical protein
MHDTQRKCRQGNQKSHKDIHNYSYIHTHTLCIPSTYQTSSKQRNTDTDKDTGTTHTYTDTLLPVHFGALFLHAHRTTFCNTYRFAQQQKSRCCKRTTLVHRILSHPWRHHPSLPLSAGTSLLNSLAPKHSNFVDMMNQKVSHALHGSWKVLVVEHRDKASL